MWMDSNKLKPNQNPTFGSVLNPALFIKPKPLLHKTNPGNKRGFKWLMISALSRKCWLTTFVGKVFGRSFPFPNAIILDVPIVQIRLDLASFPVSFAVLKLLSVTWFLSTVFAVSKRITFVAILSPIVVFLVFLLWTKLCPIYVSLLSLLCFTHAKFINLWKSGFLIIGTFLIKLLERPLLDSFSWNSGGLL